jgi:ADP-ribosylation factor 2-binding protein
MALQKETLETYVDRRLRSRFPKFSMSKFLATLRSRGPDDLEGEVFEILASFDDFVQFKEMMLDNKQASDLHVLRAVVFSASFLS